MKKLLITVCLSGLLSVPSAVLGAEMAGPSLYGSFRTGLSFGSGDASVSDFTSRWGFKGSHEVSEGLTASYKYESKFNTTNAESSGGSDSILASHVPTGTTDADNVNLENDADADEASGREKVSAGGIRRPIVLHQPFRWIWKCYIRSNLVSQCHPLRF